MIQEKFHRGQQLISRIEKCERNIMYAEHMMRDNVYSIEKVLIANGQEVIVPDGLLNIFCEIIVNEYRAELFQLIDEFKNL